MGTKSVPGPREGRTATLPAGPRRGRRRTRLLTRLGPLVLVAVVGSAFGVYEAFSPGRNERAIVRHYLAAWARGDFAAMYRMLAPASRAGVTEAAFVARYEQAARTATLPSPRPGVIRTGVIRTAPGDVMRAAVQVRTLVFGTLNETLRVPYSARDGRVELSGTLFFPGLRPGEQLSRTTKLGARGAILADGGTALAAGPDRSSPIPDVASEIAGVLGRIPASQSAAYSAAGYPPGAKVGLDGLELVFQSRLAGRPGGTLRAGDRVLARVAPRPGQTVRTTIDPTIEAAAISALGQSYAGMTVMDPRTGAVLALAGIAYSAAQPPGSTFKIVTATGALEAGIATLDTEYPVHTSVDVDGYILHNAANEACGGTLIEAFAVSCDTVFAPLGVELGATRLVSTAEAFGFDHPTGVPGALESTIPSAATIGDGVAVGASAIGQGRVQATTLEMADVAATIADAGRRPIPTLEYGAPPRFARVTTPQVANDVQQMMEAVVEYGTGTAAQIPGVQVAGKTGTAELTNTEGQTNDKAQTDGWFSGYAPVGTPRVVACALFPAAGYGATSAAPAVQQVLVAALATRL